MRIDIYRLLSDVIEVGVDKAWGKTLGKTAFSGNSEQFGRKLLDPDRLPSTVMKKIVLFFPLQPPYLHADRLMARCVITGAHYGWQRAFQQPDEPHPEAVKEALLDGIMQEINNYFDFSSDCPEAVGTPPRGRGPGVRYLGRDSEQFGRKLLDPDRPPSWRCRGRYLRSWSLPR